LSALGVIVLPTDDRSDYGYPNNPGSIGGCAVPTFATREERSPDLALEPAQVRAVAAGRVYSTITGDLDDGTVALIDGRFDPAIGSASPSTAAGAGCGQFIFPVR
jgi:hypothetical protein